MNVVIYLNEEKVFLGFAEKDYFDTYYFTRKADKATRFDSLEQARDFLSRHFPHASATFLSIIAE